MKAIHVPAAAADLTLPPGGNAGQVLGLDAAGKLVWVSGGGGAGAGTEGQRVAYSRYRLVIRTAAQANANPGVAELSLRDTATGARATGGVGSGESYGGYPATNAFDGNPATFWVSSTPQTGVLTYSLPTAVMVDEYSIQADQPYGDVEAPTSWTLEASHDGANWVALDVMPDAGAWQKGEVKTYPIPAAAPSSAGGVIPPGGSPGQVLGLDGAGKLAWVNAAAGGTKVALSTQAPKTYAPANQTGRSKQGEYNPPYALDFSNSSAVELSKLYVPATVPIGTVLSILTPAGVKLASGGVELLAGLSAPYLRGVVLDSVVTLQANANFKLEFSGVAWDKLLPTCGTYTAGPEPYGDGEITYVKSYGYLIDVVFAAPGGTVKSVVSPLDPPDMPRLSDLANLPNGGQALYTGVTPPRPVYRASDGTLYYGPAYNVTP